MIDSLLHSLIEQDMDLTTKNSIFTSGKNAVNALRTMDGQASSALGYSYSNVTYNPNSNATHPNIAAGFIQNTGLPQFEHAGQVKNYYITTITEALSSVTDEILNDGYFGDNTVKTNEVINKTGTYVTNEATLHTSLADILDALNNDPKDYS